MKPPGYDLGAIGESYLPWPPPLGNGKPNTYPTFWKAYEAVKR